MKTYKNLYQKIISFANLHLAYLNAIKGKSARKDVALFIFDWESNLLTLQRELGSEMYKPGSYRIKRIFDPKKRLIAAAPFRDRVVHHAIIQIVDPILSASFIDDSYACLKEKGSHRAVLQSLAFNRQKAYRLNLDVSKYFLTIDHDILLGQIKRRIVDGQLLGLLGTIIASGSAIYADPDNLAYLGIADEYQPASGKGLPIGNLTSQFFANLYLDSLDHFIKRKLKIRSYLRYMDNLTLFSDSKADLEQAKSTIAAFLEKSLHLRLNEKDTLIEPTRKKTVYLGYRISKSGIEPSKKMRKKIEKKLSEHYWYGTGPDRIAQSLISYRGVMEF